MYRLLFIFLFPLVFCEKGPILSLPIGRLEGHYMTSRGGSKFSAYDGVPYAQPPLGNLRWKASRPVQPWEGVKNCTVKPPMCPQNGVASNNYTIIGQEDCLYLNLYIPLDLDPLYSPLPVMVWIHGGAYVVGAGSDYGPEFLMDEGVVVITINYRLGPLGFLSLDSPEYSGNQGIRDQVLALRWIQQNLNPEKVTIFGESAGSWSVSHHILSPQSEGLFQAAIGESGTMDNGLASHVLTREEAFQQSKCFANSAKCFELGDLWNEEIVLDCLRKKSGEDLIRLANEFGYYSMGNVDEFSGDGPILPSAPHTLLEFGLFNKVPSIWGSNVGEGSLWFPDVLKDPSLLSTLDSSWDYDGPRMMFGSRNNYGHLGVEYARAARDFYFNGSISGDKLGEFVDLLTDTYFLRSVHNMVQAMPGTVPVYQYILTFRDETSFTATPGPANLALGPTHGDELQYLWLLKWNLADIDYEGWSEANLENSLRMCKMWTNFAKEGNPTPGGEVGVTWEEVVRENHKYLNIGEELVMEMTDQYTQRMAFWDRILSKDLL